MKTTWNAGSVQDGSTPCWAQKVDPILGEICPNPGGRWILIQCVETQGGGHLGQEMPSSGHLLYLEDDGYVAPCVCAMVYFHHSWKDCFRRIKVQEEIEVESG